MNSYPYSCYDSIREGDIQEALDLLKHIDNEQLNELLNDNAKRLMFVKGLTKITDLEKNRNFLIEENKRISELNLSCESNYSFQCQALLKSLEECQQLKNELFHKKSKLFKFFPQNSPDATLALMKAKTAEAEEESETIAETFLQNNINVEQFIKEFVEKRKLFHSRRVKVEKMVELFQTQQQVQAFSSTPIRQAPQPPTNFSQSSTKPTPPYPVD